MSEDKPLHVRVAEALGCRAQYTLSRWECHCSFGLAGNPPHGQGWTPENPTIWPGANDRVIRSYDTDWSATGPLIEKYGIAFRLEPPLDDPALPRDWRAVMNVDYWTDDFTGEHEATGETPLIAVCNLILALHAAGKLKP